MVDMETKIFRSNTYPEFMDQFQLSFLNGIGKVLFVDCSVHIRAAKTP